MEKERTKRKVVEVPEYEKQRRATIDSNQRRMEALNLPSLAREVNPQPEKRKRKVVDRSIEQSEPAVRRNLRSCSRAIESAQNLQATVPEQQENEGAQNECPEYEELHGQQNKKVRGRTRKTNIYARQNKPKLEVELNGRGQPCGLSCTELSNFIGSLVRTKGFPIAHSDWRKVCAKENYKLWTDSELYWKLDRGLFDWFMKKAATIWKEFKADLKKDFLKKYDDGMDEEELLDLCDPRVHEIDWKWLLDHWRSEEAIARSKRAKANRAKLTQNHTCGSKSHARVEEELREHLGRSPRRDEVFIKSHTHKTGAPEKGSEETINALKAAVTDHPELVEKSIQEGDVYFHVCGPERNGYVRVVGLGPTPGGMETWGKKIHINKASNGN